MSEYSEKEAYERLQRTMEKGQACGRLLRILDKLIMVLTVISLPLLWVMTYFIRPTLLLWQILVPASGFVLLTVVRSAINAPRPYEVYGFKPVIPKDTIGHSFPSRHVFSIFIIAVCFLQIDLTLGALMLLLGILLGFIRVFGGVHFLKDVVAGALSAMFYGELAFLLLRYFT